LPVFVLCVFRFSHPRAERTNELMPFVCARSALGVPMWATTSPRRAWYERNPLLARAGIKRLNPPLTVPY
jgi:hypothetical protein